MAPTTIGSKASRVFSAPAGGITIGIGYRRKGSKNYNDGATKESKSFNLGLAV